MLGAAPGRAQMGRPDRLQLRHGRELRRLHARARRRDHRARHVGQHRLRLSRRRPALDAHDRAARRGRTASGSAPTPGSPTSPGFGRRNARRLAGRGEDRHHLPGRRAHRLHRRQAAAARQAARRALQHGGRRRPARRARSARRSSRSIPRSSSSRWRGRAWAEEVAEDGPPRRPGGRSPTAP